MRNCVSGVKETDRDGKQLYRVSGHKIIKKLVQAAWKCFFL